MFNPRNKPVKRIAKKREFRRRPCPISQRKRRLTQLYSTAARAAVDEALMDPVRQYCPVMLEIEGKRVLVSQIHHSRGRMGPLLIDQRFWIPVSQQGHNWIHQNPSLARELKWLCPAGQWNTPPKDDETQRLRGLILEITR